MWESATKRERALLPEGEGGSTEILTPSRHSGKMLGGGALDLKEKKKTKKKK